MYTVFLDGRRWDSYKTLCDAKRIQRQLQELFENAKVKIYGPRGGIY